MPPKRGRPKKMKKEEVKETEPVEWPCDPMVTQTLALRAALSSGEEEEVRKVLQSNGEQVKKECLTTVTPATEGRLQDGLQTAAERIALLHGFESISPSALSSLASIAAVRLQTLCRQFTVSQRRRNDRLETAFPSAIHHVVCLNGMRSVMDLKEYYDKHINGALKAEQRAAKKMLGVTEQHHLRSGSEEETAPVVEKNEDEEENEEEVEKEGEEGQAWRKGKKGVKLMSMDRSYETRKKKEEEEVKEEEGNQENSSSSDTDYDEEPKPKKQKRLNRKKT